MSDADDETVCRSQDQQKKQMPSHFCPGILSVRCSTTTCSFAKTATRYFDSL